MESTATAPATCEIARLPDDLLSASLARTGPQDACRAAAVSPAFRAAADADAVWSSLLPRDLPPLADGELDPQPTKKQLFMRLSDSARPVLLADGLTSMWLDRATAAKCYMLSARELCIVWGGTPQYWRWIPLTDSRFSEGAELLDVCWLEIRGKIHCKMLSQNTTYAAYMVFKISDESYGLDYPPQEAEVNIGATKSTRQVCLQGSENEGEDGEEVPQNYQLFRPVGLLRPRVGRRNRRTPPGVHVHRPRTRADGWMEVELGEFNNEGGEDGEVSISLMEIKGGHWKKGLIVQGIEIRASLARTGPRDACRAAAADADAVWSSLLPRDLPPLADGELPADPQPTKKQLFMRLSDSARPVLLADGITSMWLDRATAAKCYMLSARKLCIIWSDTPRYWRWIPLTDSRFSEGAELLAVCWLEIRGKIHCNMLSQNTTYAAYMVFKMSDKSYGLDYPLQEAEVSIGATKSTHQVCLGYDNEVEDGEEVPQNYRSFRPVGLFRPRIGRRNRHVPPRVHVQHPQTRADGWMEMEMGEFKNEEGEDGEVSISLMETRGGNWKKGLILQGIEIRVKK